LSAKPSQSDQPALKPGQRIRVYETVDRREGNWEMSVEGHLLAIRAEKTGSWFAHGKDTRLWLNRIRLQKDDGEISTLTVDQHTRVEVLEDAPQ
jgi:hypothetical protein